MLNHCAHFEKLDKQNEVANCRLVFGFAAIAPKPRTKYFCLSFLAHAKNSSFIARCKVCQSQWSQNQATCASVLVCQLHTTIAFESKRANEVLPLLVVLAHTKKQLLHRSLQNLAVAVEPKPSPYTCASVLVFQLHTTILFENKRVQLLWVASVWERH